MLHKNVATEIVPAPEASEAPLTLTSSREDVEAMIARIVRERVDEIMVKVEAGQVEPDFLPKKEAGELRRHLNMFEQRKWSLYFEKWGCRMCHRKKVAYCGTGHCNTCHSLLTARLKMLKREYECKHPADSEIDRQIDRLTSRFRVAKSLLGGDSAGTA